jgi:hypothetical protein
MPDRQSQKTGPYKRRFSETMRYTLFIERPPVKFARSSAKFRDNDGTSMTWK